MANCCDCQDLPGENDYGSAVVWGLRLASTTCYTTGSRELHCPWEEAHSKEVRKGEKKGSVGLSYDSTVRVKPSRMFLTPHKIHVCLPAEDKMLIQQYIKSLSCAIELQIWYTVVKNQSF